MNEIKINLIEVATELAKRKVEENTAYLIKDSDDNKKDLFEYLFEEVDGSFGYREIPQAMFDKYYDKYYNVLFNLQIKE